MNAGKNPGKRIGCFGLIGIVLMLAWVSSIFNGGDSNVASTPKKTTGMYCAVLMKYLNESIDVMANAGKTASISDVSSVLEDRGTALATGFDAEMAGSVERYNAIRSAGEQLLKLRVAILDGGDITEPANQFKQDAQAIQATCQ